MNQINYSVVLKSEPDGGYTAIVPSLPGCVTYGKNVEEVQEMAKDAIKAYLTSLQKHKEPIPKEENVLLTSIRVSADLTFSNA